MAWWDEFHFPHFGENNSQLPLINSYILINNAKNLREASRRIAGRFNKGDLLHFFDYQNNMI